MTEWDIAIGNLFAGPFPPWNQSTINDVRVEPPKRCSKCGETKPADAFYWNDAAHTHRTSLCKDCAKEKVRKHKEKKRCEQKIS